MGLSFPSLAGASKVAKLSKKTSTLIMIELQGGNDGLNSVIPYNDPLYKELRPTLSLNDNEIITLDKSLALHHSLEGLMPLWEQQQCQIVLGVGYEKPNFSHFRSIEIWNTASKSNEYLPNGWLTKNLNSLTKNQINALVLGGSSGPLQNVQKTIHIRNIKQFLRNSQANNYQLNHQIETMNKGLEKIIKTQQIIDQATKQIKVNLQPLQAPKEFKNHNFAKQAALATQIIQSGLQIPVIKLKLGSFDTHINQKPKHARLLKMLAESINTMQQALEASGDWNATTIMTYSEFGRRAKENGSRGTDHGTAAPHFILGGSVNGGFKGEQPSLAHLDRNNLQYTTDFRQLYNFALKV